MRFARSSWLWIKSKNALGGAVSGGGSVACALGGGLGCSGADGGASGLDGAFSAPLGASKDLNKSNNPKDSKIKNLQNLKFYGKIHKKSVFSIALIDDLIYNRICVSIIGPCTKN